MDRTSTDHLLTTTRSVRKRLDFSRPIEREIIEECLDIAIQAPSGSDRQGWQFVMITDPDLRFQIAEIYRRSFTSYLSQGGPRGARGTGAASLERIRDSAVYLAEHFHEAPILALFCYEGRVEEAGVAMQASLYGSILPAAWSFMLALRSRGIGASWTTLHLWYEQEVAQLLNLSPKLTQAVLLPIAYYTGDDFQPAKRVSANERTVWK